MNAITKLSELRQVLDQIYTLKGTVPSSTSSGGVSAVTPHTIADNFLHIATSLTIGWVLRATGAASYAWAQLQHSDLGGVGASDHHAPVTIGVGNLSAKLGLATQVLTLAAINHSDTSSIGTDDHHAQLHKSSHAHGGGDALIEISATEPATMFAGKLWVDIS